ncbi:MAG: UvrD-helicase domain-containing protein [Candidatus Woesebacteria bacterium]|nr:MAG: UvrD-helicase domain-containing protein [Candidatus Woesebacteria bacterium]
MNKLVIGAAGSGKTTFLVKSALVCKDENVLITTYTRSNEKEIRKKIIQINKFIPENITIQTWFSFLLEHGAKPYQGSVYDKDIKGMVLVSSQSAPYVPEGDTENHYFTKNQRIFSDKLTKFVLKCNSCCKGEVVNRISRIYQHIYIDEIQDLSGYDLELLKLLLKCKSNLLLVGDPRQGTYSTSNSSKNRKYKRANILSFFGDKSITIETDTTSLTTNYRSSTLICELSNKLYPNLTKTLCGNASKTGHDGVFVIKSKDVKSYLSKHNPIQLRNDSRTNIDKEYKYANFGDSKGQEFERVILYPTEPIIKWLKDNNSELAPISRSKFYVAITRAKYSVGIVSDVDIQNNMSGIKKYQV